MIEHLFMNNGAGGFECGDSSVEDSGDGLGAALGDIDNDGDLDSAATSGAGDSQKSRLYVNLTGSDNRWIHVRLTGSDTDRAGIGARVEIRDAGALQVREIGAGSGFLGQNSYVAVFGLGDEEAVDSIRVIWPNGESQGLENVGTNLLRQFPF